jgi:hypothetical protein
MTSGDVDLQRLLTEWYGTEPAPDTALPDELAWLPEDVKNIFAGVSRTMWKGHPSRSFKRPFPARNDPGLRVFLSDAEFDLGLAVRGDSPDTVYESSWRDPAWTVVPEGLSAVVAHHLIKNMAADPRFHLCSGVVENRFADEALASFEEVSFGRWKSYPSERVFLGNRMVALMSNAHDGTWPPTEVPGEKLVEVAARNRSDLDFLSRVPAVVDWITMSPEELPAQARLDLGIDEIPAPGH